MHLMSAVNRMKLNEEAIHEFQKLYKEEYGTQISRDKAVEYGENLIGLVKVVYGKQLLKSFDRKCPSEYDKHGHN